MQNKFRFVKPWVKVSYTQQKTLTCRSRSRAAAVRRQLGGVLIPLASEPCARDDPRMRSATRFLEGLGGTESILLGLSLLWCCPLVWRIKNFNLAPRLGSAQRDVRLNLFGLRSHYFMRKRSYYFMKRGRGN